MICPYCSCSDGCGREGTLSLPRLSRSVEVLSAVVDLHLKKPSVIDTYSSYLSRDLVLWRYFDEHDPPTLTDVEHAQDLLRQVEV